MTERHPIAETRRNLPRPIRNTERGRTVEPTRRSFADSYRDVTASVDLTAPALDPDAGFGDIRDMSPGRSIRIQVKTFTPAVNCEFPARLSAATGADPQCRNIRPPLERKAGWA